jgi:hypothetical protein
VRLGDVVAAADQLQVNLWGGGPGFRLDKLVLTRDPEPPGGGADRAPSFIRETTPSWNDVKDQAYQTYELQGRYGGPEDTRGRSGMACDTCNALYGLRVLEEETIKCDNTLDDTFDDAQPIRAAKEAAKSFVRRLRARFDQVAFVQYSDTATISRKLNCVWQRGPVPAEYGVGVYDPESEAEIKADNAWTWCFDHRTGPSGYELDTPPDTSVQSGSVVYAIESVQPNGWTNIADALQKGMDVLEPSEPQYGRPYALRFVILMTDGVPNRYPGKSGQQACYEEDLWPDNSGSEAEIRARDCVIYYAREAKTKGIAVFTIGLGLNVDQELLAEVARTTGGEAFLAERAEELEAIFQEIANRIFLRLVE